MDETRLVFGEIGNSVILQLHRPDPVVSAMIVVVMMKNRDEMRNQSVHLVP